MTLPLPPFLKTGDCIGIAATARWVSREQLQPALDLFTGWGLRVKVADQVYTHNFQLAGSADLRCSGLQEMLEVRRLGLQGRRIVRAGHLGWLLGNRNLDLRVWPVGHNRPRQGRAAARFGWS